MIKNGISEENLMKLFTHAQIGPKEQDMVRNLSFLGVNIVSDVSRCAFFSYTTTSRNRDSINRVTERKRTQYHERSASPNTLIKCPDGHRSSKI